MSSVVAAMGASMGLTAVRPSPGKRSRQPRQKVTDARDSVDQSDGHRGPATPARSLRYDSGTCVHWLPVLHPDLPIPHGGLCLATQMSQPIG